MRQIGIAVRVVIGNSSDIPAGHRSGALQMSLTTRNFGNLPDPVATLLQDFGPDGGDWDAMSWRNEEVMQTLTRLAADRRTDVGRYSYDMVTAAAAEAVRQELELDRPCACRC